MEHLLFHWEDITDVLIDELIEEEVIERNQIEALELRHDSGEEGDFYHMSDRDGREFEKEI